MSYEHVGNVFMLNGAPYPLTIVRTRYGGTYEGAEYAAFARSAFTLPDGWDGGDTECCETWIELNTSGEPIGKGRSPQDALASLISKIKGAA
jgi:hypothetical protein